MLLFRRIPGNDPSSNAANWDQPGRGGLFKGGESPNKMMKMVVVVVIIISMDGGGSNGDNHAKDDGDGFVQGGELPKIIMVGMIILIMMVICWWLWVNWDGEKWKHLFLFAKYKDFIYMEPSQDVGLGSRIPLYLQVCDSTNTICQKQKTRIINAGTDM